MGKIVVKMKNGRCRIVNRLTPSEIICYEQLEITNARVIPEIRPINVIRRRHSFWLETNYEKETMLQSYIEERKETTEFLFLIEQFATLFLKCQEVGICLEHLVLEPTMISMGQNNQISTVVYWPVMQSKVRYPVIPFLKSIADQGIFLLSHKSTETHEIWEEYIDFMNSMKVFDSVQFHHFVLSLVDKYTMEEQPAGVTWANRLPKSFFQKTEGESIGQDEKEDEYGETTYDFKLHQEEEEYGKTEKEEVCPEDEDGVLPTLAFENVGSVKAYLIRYTTGEEIQIDKGLFRIGKNKRFVDYAIEDNPTVSSIHADIIQKEKEFYLFDNQSTNKSYIDNQVIISNQEIPIYSGCKLRFSNEEFTFVVKE